MGNYLDGVLDSQLSPLKKGLGSYWHKKTSKAQLLMGIQLHQNNKYFLSFLARIIFPFSWKTSSLFIQGLLILSINDCLSF